MYHFNGAGKLIVESKDDTKVRLMRSPDMADAFLCTFAENVVPKAHRHEEELPHVMAAVANNGGGWVPPWSRN